MSKKDLESIKEWVDSIDSLVTNPRDAIATSGTGTILSNQKDDDFRKTRPLKIFCGLTDVTEDNTEIFDLHIIVKKKKLVITGKILEKKISEIYTDLNTIKLGPGTNLLLNRTLNELFGEVDNNLLKLHFIINQLIMLINNPMIFSYPSYAEKFKKESSEK